MLNHNIGNAGEFYVLAQLAQQGYIAGKTDDGQTLIDIIATDPSTLRTVNIQVKTTKYENNVIPYGEEFWKSLNSQTIVYDLIYNPAPTTLLKFSAKKGCMTIDGLEMLVAQGIKSLSFWTDGLEVPFHVMNDALKKYL